MFTIFELQCLLFAFICLLKDPSPEWRSSWLFLVITCVTEFTGIYLKRQHLANQWPYNILLIFQILFFSYMFWALFGKNNRKKRFIIVSGLIILTLFYLYDLSQHGFYRFNTVAYNSMSVILVIYSLYYFYMLLKQDSYVKLKFSAAFWWSCGVLFFYFGDTAVNLFRGKLSKIMITQNHALPYFILMLLNIILYSCWSYSFICKKWLTKKSEIL
jgi:hypothetical protein